MRNIYLVLFFIAANHTFAKAQTASAYYFNVKSGVALEDLSSGSHILLGSGKDDESSAVINIPFTFRFASVDYNGFSVSSNGLLGLGSTPVDLGYFDYALIQTSTYPVLSPWADDLHTASNGGVKYETVVLPNGLKKLIIEWNVRSLSDRSTTSFNKTYQVWLFEGSNKIQFVYGNATVYKYNNSTIGIAAANTDYISVNSSDNTPSTTNGQQISHVWPGYQVSYILDPSGSTPIDPISLATNTVVTNVSCHSGRNGMITLGNISGGDGSYVITWTSANGFTALGSSITNLSAGTYSYAITDATQTSTVIGEVTVLEPSAITLTAEATNVSINGAADGHISVTTNGSYIIKDIQGNDVTNNTGFSAGVYTIAATREGNNGDVCFATPIQVEITEPEVLKAVVATVEHVKCNGEGSGSVTISATGGIAPYTYTLNQVSNSSGTFSNLTEGSYTFTVTDANGAVTELASSVQQPTVLEASIVSIKDNSCGAENSGSITINANGGTPDYYYTLSGTTTSSSSYTSTNTTGSFSNLSSGSYNIQVKDANGCMINVSDLNIKTLQPLNATLTMSPVYPIAGQQKHTIYRGYGPQYVTLSATVINGVSNTSNSYSYSWAPSERLYSIAATAWVAPTVTTTYTVTITDGNGCSVSESITVNVIDVRCGNKLDKVTMCKNGREECVEPKNVEDRIKRGETLGTCNSSISTLSLDSKVSSEIELAQDVIIPNGTLSKEAVRVYPNPSSGHFTIELNNYLQGPTTVIVMDLHGRHIIQKAIDMKGNQRVSLNLSEQPAGTYIIKVIRDTGIQTSKIIIK